MAEAGSPDHGRLDRLLNLVTAHDAHSHQQDIRVADMAQRLAQLEAKAAKDAALFKERNVTKELDMARMAVETLAKQNISLASEVQQLQAQQKAEASKLEQWQMAADALMASLQLDIGHLRAQLAEVQESCRCDLQHLEQAITSSKAEIRAYLDERLGASAKELKLDLSAFKAQYAGITSAATKTIESWARGELAATSSRLGESVANCSKQGELLAAQMELLRNQVVVAGQEQAASAQEGKRLKKHLIKLQQQAQGLALMQPAMAQTQQDQRRLQVALQQMADQLDAQSREQQQRLQQAEAAAATQAQDLARLAHNVGACIKSAVTTTARLAGLPAPASASSYSYLSSLLAPIPPTVAPAARPASAFDVCMAEYDSFTDALKGRAAEEGRQAGSSSPPPPVLAPRPRGSPSIRSSLDRQLLRGLNLGGCE